MNMQQIAALVVVSYFAYQALDLFYSRLCLQPSLIVLSHCDIFLPPIKNGRVRLNFVNNH